MDDPYYNRRFRGTPARKFITKTTRLTIGIGVIIGVGFHFMALAVKGSSPYKEVVSKHISTFEEIMAEKRVLLSFVKSPTPEPTEFDNISAELEK